MKQPFLLRKKHMLSAIKPAISFKKNLLLALLSWCAWTSPMSWLGSTLLDGASDSALFGNAWIAHAQKGVDIDRSKIVVNQLVFSKNEFNQLLNLQVNALKTKFKGQQLQKRIELLKSDLEKEIITSMLLESHAKTLKITIPEQELADRVDAMVTENPNLTKQVDRSQVYRFIARNLLRQAVINREVNAKIVISDWDIKHACQKFLSDSREVDVGHILLTDTSAKSISTLNNLRAQIKKGADFAKLARTHSQDPSAVQNNGRLGYVRKGQLVEPFEKVAFSLKVGEVSEPVRTRFGVHLIVMFGEKKGKKINCSQLPDENRASLENQLFQQRQAMSTQKLIEKLRKRAKITVF